MRCGGAIALLLFVAACESPPDGTAGPSPQASPIATPVAQGASATALGAVTDLALAPSAVYALYAPAGTEGALEGAPTTMLARIDRASGAVLTVGPIPGALHVAVGGAWVWVGSGSDFAGSTSNVTSVRRFNARSLAADAAFAPPSEIEKAPSVAPLVTASATGVWWASGGLLFRMNPDSGAVVQRQSTIGPASSLTLDVAGGKLYVGADAASDYAQATVTEYDAQTLQPIVSTTTGGAHLAGPHVAVSGGDVWIAYATGMLGMLEHRRASDLAAMPVADRQYTNGIRVFAAGGYVWASDAMASRLACLDPVTGASRASRAVQFGGVVAGDAGGLYLGDIKGVGVLTPDPKCSSR